MENGSSNKRWQFAANEEEKTASLITVRGTLRKLIENLNEEDDRTVVPLGGGDPSSFPSFRTTSVAVNAVVDALRSSKYNCYAPTAGILPAKRAIATYLSRDLPYELSPEDVFVTHGCSQAIEIALAVLGRRRGANVLVPRPGFPYYEAFAAKTHVEVRHFDLLPENGWEVDLEAVESLADDNTVAIVIINPGNPCGNVYSFQHLKDIAEKARKLGITVIADEVYAHLTFGSNPFVPMGVFGSEVPVMTLGSISKRWVVPGWRLGWLALTDPNRIFHNSPVVDSIKSYLDISPDSVTFIQGAIPQILTNIDEDFFIQINKLLRDAAQLCYDRIQNIPCITCPNKPQGSMFVMAKLNLSLLEDIKDDVDFCLKLSREESVIVVPGMTVGVKNWLRITFATEYSTLDVGLNRIKAFCERHAKKH